MEIKTTFKPDGRRGREQPREKNERRRINNPGKIFFRHLFKDILIVLPPVNERVEFMATLMTTGFEPVKKPSLRESLGRSRQFIEKPPYLFISPGII